ncbi:unnamed protein product [Cuscuta europaea]|uniref:Peptidase A1 domain-containing protein n=1 Tax=Cuscuta europaea TaxID=41803 RepID=A0A9P1E4H2_CUSEU|nr:unnamed protein product [Cuscuta europaea]
MAASKHTYLNAFLIVFSLFSLLSAEMINGFKMELIHPHSPANPLRDVSKTKHGWVREAYKHALSRAASIHSGRPGESSKFETDIKVAGGGYVMQYSIGNPRFETYGIADTGSVVTWTQCEPCTDCFPQVLPLFDPKNSKTYHTTACGSSQCSLIDFPGCSDDNTCQYKVAYGDRSQTFGDVAIDTLTMGDSSFDNVVFGCGHQNKGTFSNGTSGIVGLGNSPVSIIQQLDQQIQGKFAYCLSSEPESKSHILFGSEAKVQGPNAVKTPIIKYPTQPSFYWLSLESLSVGGKKFHVKKSVKSTSNVGGRSAKLGPKATPEPNIIIDSGTTLTMIPSGLFASSVAELKRSIRATPVDDPEGIFGLCYPTQDLVEVPDIVAHFSGGADVKLSQKGTFLEVEAGLTCLTIITNSNIDLSIFGNLSEIDYLVGYDLEEQTVTFKPTDCASF